MSEPPEQAGPAQRYVRESRIAAGGMGEVWRARDTVLGREVAVKLLKPEYADDATFRARFDAEARHAALLHHAGIASVFDYGVDEESHTPYLVMELVDGKPLSDLLAGGRPVDPQQARQLIAQVADALGAAHAAGVVHRDVKPANLLVTPDARVKVTDFGIARAVDSVPITMTGQIVGTPHYLSPEQARGDQATAASDVYALGVVLFECLAGHRPFSGETPVTTALAHIREEIPPLPGTVPADLVAVVHTAMAKDPAERYPDGNAFAAALRGEGATRLPPVVRAPVPPLVPPAEATAVMAGVGAPAAAAAAVTRGPVREEQPSASRWPWALAGLVTLLVVGLLLATRPWEGQRSSDNPAPTPTPSGKAPSPTVTRSRTPTGSPSDTPTRTPSERPTERPTDRPSDTPTSTPTRAPSQAPSSPVVPSLTASPGANGRGQTEAPATPADGASTTAAGVTSGQGG